MATTDFAEFYASAKDRCLRAAVASGMSPAAAEDAVAEAFARAYASWPTVRRADSPAAWVVRTAVNADISWWRRRRRETPARDDDHALELAAPAVAREDVLDALTAIRGLPPRQREVVVLRHLLDLDTATTAAELGIAPGTVTAHLNRAHQTLRAQLAPATPERTTP